MTWKNIELAHPWTNIQVLALFIFTSHEVNIASDAKGYLNSQIKQKEESVLWPI